MVKRAGFQREGVLRAWDLHHGGVPVDLRGLRPHPGRRIGHVHAPAVLYSGLPAWRRTLANRRRDGQRPTKAGYQNRRRPGRPGVTTAPTTAALATGRWAGCDGRANDRGLCDRRQPGVAGGVTTAAFATGAPTTPTRPLRPALSGMSASCCFEFGVRLDGGDDGFDGDSAIGDELAPGSTCGRGKRHSAQPFS